LSELYQPSHKESELAIREHRLIMFDTNTTKLIVSSAKMTVRTRADSLSSYANER